MIPPALERFVELVNRGEYWESHEALESAWRKNRSDFLQGLILYASGFVHVERGSRHGIDAQLAKAEAKLAPYPDAYLGIHVAELRAHIRRCRKIVAAHPAASGDAWAELIPFAPVQVDRTRIRGDEPELE